jgi:hypothetical protein
LSDSLVNLIIEKLKTGSIKNVVLFSDIDVIPKPPYAVVKPETGIVKNTRSFRIIAHMKKGDFDKLENYVLKELDGLLLAGYLTNKEGDRFKLYPNGFTDVTPEKEDNSYFAERLYYSPLTVRG